MESGSKTLKSLLTKMTYGDRATNSLRKRSVRKVVLAHLAKNFASTGEAWYDYV